ncbi:MAG TPA: aldehyde dehydrogenase family protein [Polyangia bacterium]|nr:aldehyde dehydrogenase family protein [Polyangia bacterium]
MSANKVTYVSLSADDPAIDAGFTAAIADARAALGALAPLRVAGATRSGVDGGAVESRNPADTRMVVARVATGGGSDLRDAVAAARAAFPSWSGRPWQERVAIIERAADIVRERKFELSVWMILEMGKNRVEALGEIEETADLLAYYAGQMRANDGYVHEMDRLAPTDRNVSVLRPYGVWAVIAPWNFPYALLGAPVAAALLAGNTVVCKPSSETPLSGVKLAEIFHAAGVPAEALTCLPGSGRVIGDGLVEHPDVAGVTFTGSYDVGFKRLYQRFAGEFPKPAIVEMGGKNPALVMASADVAQAVQGIYRSAFGMNGHKCSACSRVYVHRAVAGELLAGLARAADAVVPADPLDKGVFVGPVATRQSYEDYQRYVALARQTGDVVRAGGAVLTDGARAHGYFVRPTVLAGLPRDHQLVREELFVPIVAVETVDNLDEALARANDTKFGLTAGLFSREQKEIDAFFDRIEAGVVYVNRAAGATTGAWPGVQPFGGWKGSGSTGKNIGGHYTLPLYLREQSRTVCQ